MNNWQPIDTAPKDGTVVLTNEGLVKWSDKLRWGRPIGWIACDVDGCPFRCCEEGPWEMSPNWWMVMPPIPQN